MAITENHPYIPFFDSNTQKLIIGTTPPMRFSQRLPLNQDDVDFYYGSRDNYFWDIIGDVFGIRFIRQNSDEAISQRQDFLTKHFIGLVDIVDEFSRKENNASDTNLEVTKFQDIFTILKENVQIQNIFFTGYSGSNSAESLTSKHLGEYKIFNTIVSHHTPKHKIFRIEDQIINSYSLFSPSPAARKKYDDILSLYQILKS